MSSPPPPPSTEEEATDVDMDEDNQFRWEEAEQEDDDNVDVEVAAVVDEEHVVEMEDGTYSCCICTCCICMEAWTADGTHRICCLPCGHVFGRSCLEKWFYRCGNTGAKCPQCCQLFDHNHITNLHLSGNAWDDICRLEELSKKVEQISVYVRSNLESQQILMEQLALAERLLENIELTDEIEVAEATTKLRAVKSRIAEEKNKLGARKSQFESMIWEDAAQDAAAVVQAEFLSIKEQMRKMADQQNATPVDLLRFMDENGAKLWQAIRPSRPPATMAACTGTMED